MRKYYIRWSLVTASFYLKRCSIGEGKESILSILHQYNVTVLYFDPIQFSKQK